MSHIGTRKTVTQYRLQHVLLSVFGDISVAYVAAAVTLRLILKAMFVLSFCGNVGNQSAGAGPATSLGKLPENATRTEANAGMREPG